MAATAQQKSDKMKESSSGPQSRPSETQNDSTDGNSQNFTDGKSQDFTGGNGFTEWNGQNAGRLGASLATPSLEAGLSLCRDLHDLAQDCADQAEENMKVMENSCQKLSDCQDYKDYTKAASEINQEFVAQWARCGGQMAALATDFAGRRLRAMSTLASTASHRTSKALKRSAASS